MNSDIIQGNWTQFKGLVREKWAKLTDQDLEELKGKGMQVGGYLQEKLGLAKQAAQKEFDALVKEYKHNAQREESAKMESKQAVTQPL